MAAQLVEGKVDLATFETPASDSVRDPARGSVAAAPRARFLPSALRRSSSARRNAERARPYASTAYSATTRARQAPRPCCQVPVECRALVKREAVRVLERVAQELSSRRPT